ncbi:MAG: hypothetical protein ACTSRP_06560 [Candidatus Helarchaeota archaeon]
MKERVRYLFKEIVRDDTIKILTIEGISGIFRMLRPIKRNQDP